MLTRMETTNSANWKEMNERLAVLEDKKYEREESIEEPKNFSHVHGRHNLAGTPANTEGEAPVPIQSRDLKWEYEALRDSVNRIKLPARYRINDSKSGISAKDREQVAVLVRSGKFVETGLKLLLETQKQWGNFQQVAELLDGVQLALTAHMRYLQEEHNGLDVAGQYGMQAKAVFKSIQRNTSNLQPEDIEDLKTMVSILPQPLQQVNSQNSLNSFRGGFRQTHRSRGNYFRGRGRGSFQNSFGYQPRAVPNSREFEQGDDTTQ